MLDMIVAIKEYYPNGCVYRSNTTSPQVNSSSTEDLKVQFQKGRERFLREARVLAKFSGEPGIVDVRDFFEEYNTAYIVMEFLDGETRKSYLKREGKLAPEKAVSLLMPIMTTLKEVHAHGLIHRDISPDNIMLVRNKIKLLDFGAARDITDGNKSLSVMLKPGYAPEEQYRSKGQQGPWTDVYALCATLYKCITGITPDDSMQRVYLDEVRPVSALGIAISPTLDAALMKGMAIMQNNRYQNIDELLYGIEHEQPEQPKPVIEDDDDGATVIIMNDEILNRPVAPKQELPRSLICHRCGKELKPGVKFCHACGARQEGKANIPPKAEANIEPVAAPSVAPAPAPVAAPVAAPIVEPAPTPVATPISQPTPSPVAAPSANICASCGNPLKPNAKFCTICGKPIVSAPTPTPTASPGEKLCTVCGKALKPGAKFCIICGTKVASNPAAPAAPAVNLCQKCGNPLRPNAKFCTICGKPVATSQTAPANVCKNCGKAHKPGQRFCTGCGASLV